MNHAWLVALMLLASQANAIEWLEVGADTEAKYYIDLDSISIEGENVTVQKRGIYTHVLTDNFAGRPTVFKETIGSVEIDCVRRINRIIQIDMIGEGGEVVWSSGPMKKRMWEDVRPNTHAATTVETVCARIKAI